ncbi:hypothetical protein CCR75_002103 [Bremia lactucae]|uniref:Uncharacterized protein n=1 Tax=Bremia lactucae TaxID=4779 RepID=A0A976FNY7_BRELC|nr:hypothetical protein CCR75_006263 [Bremia lactucae]TDH69909.1 hypothetical protein CCR75_002103 [Bremia lactucae]
MVLLPQLRRLYIEATHDTESPPSNARNDLAASNDVDVVSQSRLVCTGNDCSKLELDSSAEKGLSKIEQITEPSLETGGAGHWRPADN